MSNNVHTDLWSHRPSESVSLNSTLTTAAADREHLMGSARFQAVRTSVSTMISSATMPISWMSRMIWDTRSPITSMAHSHRAHLVIFSHVTLCQALCFSSLMLLSEYSKLLKKHHKVLTRMCYSTHLLLLRLLLLCLNYLLSHNYSLCAVTLMFFSL